MVLLRLKVVDWRRLVAEVGRRLCSWRCHLYEAGDVAVVACILRWLMVELEVGQIATYAASSATDAAATGAQTAATATRTC